VYTITDPPIRAVRRVIPPIRIGGARLEFSWSIVMLVCLALIWALGLVA
jgi:YggT family protein